MLSLSGNPLMPAYLALLLGYVMSMFYRSFLAIVAGDLSRDLGFGASELSGLSSAWLVAFALAQIPLGPLLDRFGGGRMVAACSLLSVGGAIAFSLSQSYAMSLAAMAAIGVGCAANLMGATVYVARFMPPRRFALMLAVLISVGSIGQLLGATPLALATQAFGWRATLLSTAGLSLISGLAILATVKDHVRRPGAEAVRVPALTGALLIARLPALHRMLPVIFMSYAVVISERSLWIGPYLAQVHGFDTIAIGNAALVMSLLMAFGALAFGPAERLMRGPKPPALWSCVVVGAAFILLGASSPQGLAVPIILFCLIGFFGMSYGTLMAHARLFIPDHLIGVGVTFINFVFMGGSGIVQLLSGLFIDHAEAAGIDAPHRYAILHLAFGIALLAATAIYAGARRRPERRPVVLEKVTA
ncbi:Predicted arabinose efflux permease, MFS family [Rhizobiales bacterium GAS188]|nr:Predicted arabinose efflux permease, MFS family [Rhizobiales bacterium GAS188]